MPAGSIRRAVEALQDDWAIAFDRDGHNAPMRAEIRDAVVIATCARLPRAPFMEYRSTFGLKEEDFE